MSNRTFHYGKHAGRTVDQVVNLDPKYIIWCFENKAMRDSITEGDYNLAIDILFARTKAAALKKHNKLANWCE